MKIHKLLRQVLEIVLLSLIIIVAFIVSDRVINTEQKTIRYYNSIKDDPVKLTIFINQMPKGGMLHYHLSGSSYAENLIRYGNESYYCVDPKTFVLSINKNCPANQQLTNAVNNPDFYRDIVEHWSMMDFKPGEQNQESTEAHFFPTFIDFGDIVVSHMGDLLSEVASRGGREHLNYMEIMLTPFDLGLVGSQGDLSAALGTKLGWNNNFSIMREKLLANGLKDIVAQIPAKITTAENQMRSNLKCGTANADPGCKVTIRYQFIALRNIPPEQTFADLVTAFEAAKLDPRIVGINLVQAEDGSLTEKYYTLQMQMVRYLHQQYPNVHITLHAGELAPESVPPEALRSHIRDAINIAGAERIGHGTDIAHEDNSTQLLNEMAAKHILVEVNLTSNAKLLGVKGADHPLPLYLEYHVPVSLSTDDEGVLRTDINREFVRAALTYNLSYPTLKMFARNGLTYAFIQGTSLWKDPDNFIPVAACSNDIVGNDKMTTSCAAFLKNNPKAQLQWDLEKQFTAFEKNIAQS